MTIQRLSIITINLNNKAGLQKTMASVLCQTFTDYEYIIIDGGSTDGSLDVIKQFEDQINFWVSEPDKGIYNAMNKGVVKAMGKYYMFLNSGDYLAKSDSLSTIFENQLNEDIVYWNFFLVTREQKILKYVQPAHLSASFFYNGTINHQSCLIKRELFDKYGKYDENYTIASDWLFFLKTIVFGNATSKYINAFLTYYDGDGTSANNDYLAGLEKEKITSELFPFWIKYDFERLKKLDSTVWMLTKSDFHPTVKFAFKCFNKLISLFWFKKR